MNTYGLTEKEKNIIKEYCGYTYGTLPLQDDLMLMMMDKRLFGFDLAAANSARKIIGKKLMNKIPELHQQILEKAKSPALGKYIWEVLFTQELGYAFNKEHTYSYSLIGVQCAYLATYFNPVYWNTACLRVDAGLEEDASTNYGKIAKAVGEMMYNNIPFSLVDINKSGYMFEPDIESGSILYGMKALNGIGGEIIQTIIENRPYTSLADFQQKVKCNKTVMISLIKSGAFDSFGKREEIMKEYIWSVCNPKKRITLQNFNGLMERNLIPEHLEFQKRLFVFNKALKANCKNGDDFIVRDNYYDFYEEFFDVDFLKPNIDGELTINQKVWKKLYDKGMDPARTYFKQHQQELLDKLNNTLFQEVWDKYAEGTLSDWEMDSLGFYYHPHVLKNVDCEKYNIHEYKYLPEDPVVDYTFKRNNMRIPIFKTLRIVGTVIAKDDNKSSISILTANSGVVTVKFSRTYYARYNRRISEVQIDGTKKVRENGWFTRGTKVMVNGFRRGNMFFEKTYKRTSSHGLYKITQINEDGTLEFTNKRWGEEDDE